MKKLAFFFLLCVAAVACQKELNFNNAGTGTTGGTGGGGNPPPDTAYYVKFKLNGVAFDYRTSVTAVKTSFPAPLNIKSLIVQGRPGSALQPAIAVDVRDAVDIVINKTYTEVPVSGTFSSILYRDSTGENFSSAFVAPFSGFECRFTEITATYVKGTFKGKTQSIGGVNREITEGQFYAKIL